MLVRWMKIHKYIMIQDQQWGYLRIMVLILGILSMITLVTNTATNTAWDYFRIAATLIAVTAFMAVHDGVGEEGMVSGGKFYPWSEVRSYDYKEEKNHTAVYFTVESQNEKKPDEYTTKELDFSNQDKEVLIKFLKLNLGRKYTRMKKK
jgi:hypothetical protein